MTELHDFITHRASWRSAIVACVERAAVVGDETEQLYWNHELKAFDRTFALFDGAKP